MLLSRPAILRHLEQGHIVIDPYTPENLNTASYDVSLGPWYYREQEMAVYGSTLYNPYDESHVRRVWGDKPNHATPVSSLPELFPQPPGGLTPNDEVIVIGPGETILGHTLEFIGGATDRVCTMMKARSSLGRNFIEVCKCAGWGDIPYFNRWTMEITNNSRRYFIPLVVGRRIGQIVFFEAEPVKLDQDYTVGGKYQTSRSLEDLKRDWNPGMMLPRMHLDRESRAARAKAHGG
ncbi:MAG: Deoxycytidine triphosphate deaminase [Myxococcota bacterium]|nr:Deoxycytidine triphosphate deaminase [Myxococcota bacterium]